MTTALGDTDYAPERKRGMTIMVSAADPLSVIFNKQPQLMHRNIVEDHRLK